MGNDEFMQWSNGWVKEGYYIRYDMDDGATYYEYVLHRMLLHYEMPWGIAPDLTDLDSSGRIPPASASGPWTPENLEVTKNYVPTTGRNYMWQMIFGIQPQVFIYIELPGDLHRHGLPKIPKPSASTRKVSHFEEWMSAYLEPTFLTEHWMMRQGSLQTITFEAYNPQDQAETPWLNFLINALDTQRIATEMDGKVTAFKPRWNDLANKLFAGTVPSRPLSLFGVRSPAAS